VGGLAAVAAAVLLLFLPTRNSRLHWQRLHWQGGGVAQAIAVHNAAWRGDVLEQTQTAELDCARGAGGLVLDRRVRVDMRKGTRAKFCPPATTAKGLQLPIELIEGELLVHVDRTQGPVFLAVTTPEGQVRVTGTSVSIDRGPNGTCVCVAKGSVVVERAGRAPLSVTAGGIAYLFADGSEPRVANEPELHALFGSEDAWRSHNQALVESMDRWNARSR